MESLGSDHAHGRSILLFELPADWSWPESPPEQFTLFIAADVSQASKEMLRSFATAVRFRCAYVCAWGNDCEVVHDVFDDVYLDAEAAGEKLPFLMSTWHPDESLAEALYFALVLARPTEKGWQSSTFVAAVQTPWLAQVRGLLLDQDELNRVYVAG